MNIAISTSIILFLFFSSPSWGQHKEHQHDQHQHQENSAQTSDKINKEKAIDLPCDNVINVKVNGLVCDFCAQALEKTIGKRDDVTGIDVDLNQGNVSIAMKQGELINDAELNKLIRDSGYDVVAIKKGC